MPSSTAIFSALVSIRPVAMTHCTPVSWRRAMAGFAVASGRALCRTVPSRSRNAARSLAGSSPGGRCTESLLAGDGRDVRCDVGDVRVGQGALEGGHDALAVRDPLDDLVGARLRVVEVRADRARGAGVSERM